MDPTNLKSPKTRYDFCRLFVLAAISDDYEEPGHILENVQERARLCGMVIQPGDVRRSLIDLVESGLAKAYCLSVDPPLEIQSVPPMDQFQDYYFWITPNGKEAFLSTRDQLPLDEEDNLLPGWLPPTE